MLSLDDIDMIIFQLTKKQQKHLWWCYGVHLLRICKLYFTECEWTAEVTPEHIEHAMSDSACQQSQSVALDLMLNDEKKMQECVTILRETSTYKTATHAKTGLTTEEPKAPYTADQLTRHMMDRAQKLVVMADEEPNKFANLGPFVTSNWHVKQDFIHVSIN